MSSADSKGRAVCPRARNHNKLVGTDERPKRQRRLSLLRTPGVIPLNSMQSAWEYLLLSLPGSVNGSHLFSGGDVERNYKRLGLKTTEKKPDSQRVGAAAQLGLSYEPGIVKHSKRLGSLPFPTGCTTS